MLRNIYNNYNIRKLLTHRTPDYLRRQISSSSLSSKKYKYAINKKSQQPSLDSKSGGRNQKSKAPVVEGKTLTYFQFTDPTVDTSSDYVEQRSPKQLAYAEIVKQAVESLLSAKTSPKEVQDIVIDIVDVEVSSSLTSAFLVWTIPRELETKYTKEETEALLIKYITYFRSELPAHSTITQTPTINFAYDTFTERQEEIDKLFELIRVNPETR